MEFFRLLPFEAAKAAYRLAIQELHPDRGGDPIKAARLNAAWQWIESEIFKQL
jgi:curved DNA-binding protein CbpA